MEVTRQDLIDICDKFLQDKIGKKEVEDFALNIITSDEYKSDDEVIDDILFEWDNEEINVPINEVNMQLWKQRLLTGNDKLIEHNIWNVHIEKQKFVCKKYGSKWSPINKKLRVGVSDSLYIDPIHGLRHPNDRQTTKGTTGWLIWTGEYTEEEDFFKPMCAEHLLQIRPDIIKYLGLEAGFRFLTDGNGYEDVWFDETLMQID